MARPRWIEHFYLAAVLPWGVLAPLNLIKLLLNKVSPGAHLWVPYETEQCQAACGVARMWAQLFWSLQFVFAVAYVHVHYNREQTGLVYAGIAAKLIVGTILLKAYLQGVIHWPIGLTGAACDWLLAAAFAYELRSRRDASEPPPFMKGMTSFMEDELTGEELRQARAALRDGSWPAPKLQKRLSSYRSTN